MPTVHHGRPSSARQPVHTPGISDRRRRFERASAPWVARMAALPPFVIPVVLATALFFGLVLKSSWAGLPMVAISLFLGWLGALSWPQLSPWSRVLRGLVIGSIGLFGLVKLFGII
jgi:Family of unknown function (DUF6703)